MNESIETAQSLQQAAATGSSRIASFVILLLVLWFVTVTAYALSGGFDTPAGQRPLPVLLAICVPVLLFALAALGLVSFRAWLLALDMRRLVLLHSWRMLGLGFVFLMFQQQLPPVFALPAGLGDAFTAMAALWLGIAMYDSPASVTPGRIALWNSLGLLDFVVAVSTGVLSRSGGLLHFEGQVTSEIMGGFPLVLVPAFAVPFYIMTHIIIFMQLHQRRRA